MKRSRLNSRFAVLAFAALAGAWALTVSLPSQLTAQQDIDDVIGGLDRDFSTGAREEVKQSNKELANEQNREDIRIEEEERRLALEAHETTSTTTTTTTTTTPPAPTSATVTLNLTATVNDADVAISFGAMASVFSGTITTAMPLNLVIPGVPLGANTLGITCQSSTPGPNCNITLSGLVNTTCSPLTVPPIAANPATAFIACNVTAP